MYSLTLINLATGEFIAAHDIDVWRHSYGKNGCLRLQITFTPENLIQTIDNDGVILCTVFYYGAPVWRGRSEKIRLKDNKVVIEALGLIRAYADNYCLFEISSTSYSRFRPLNQTDRSDFNEDMFLTDVNNRLNIGLKKGTTYATTVAGVIGTRLAGEAEKQLQGVQGAIEYNLPVGYTIALYSGTGYDYNTGSYSSLGSWAGTGAQQTSAFASIPVANQGLLIMYLSPPAAAFAGEDGTKYARVTRLRLVTTNDRLINTTLSNAVAAGASQVFVLAAGNTNLIAGMEVALNPGHATAGEIVTVLSVTGSGFVASPTKAHAIGTVVRGFATPPELPTKEVIGFQSALVPSLSSNIQSFVQNFPVDITDMDLFKKTRLEALEEITGYGNGATPASPLRTRVFADKILRLEAATYAAKTWYVYLKDFEIERSLEDVINVSFGYLKRSDNTDQRTGGLVDTTRVNAMGIYRTGVVEVNTTSVTVATRSATALLDENKFEGITVSIEIDQILTEHGAEAPWEEIKADDYCIVMDLPSRIVGSALDRLRRFRISEVEIDVINGSLKLTPDIDNPFISFFQTR